MPGVPTFFAAIVGAIVRHFVAGDAPARAAVGASKRAREATSGALGTALGARGVARDSARDGARDGSRDGARDGAQDGAQDGAWGATRTALQLKCDPSLLPPAQVVTRTVSFTTAEMHLAPVVNALAAAHPAVKIGSYPKEQAAAVHAVHAEQTAQMLQTERTLVVIEAAAKDGAELEAALGALLAAVPPTSVLAIL